MESEHKRKVHQRNMNIPFWTLTLTFAWMNAWHVSGFTTTTITTKTVATSVKPGPRTSSLVERAQASRQKRPLFSSPVDDNDFQTFIEQTVLHVFPGAMTYDQLLDYLRYQLQDRAGYEIPTTLCATSLCSDELNRPLELKLQQTFGETYNLGGLAGCPFGGVTSFRKMKLHIPDGGQCLVLYGPHVGVDATGTFGKCDRKKINNMARPDEEHLWCCRSAILAAQYATAAHRGEIDPSSMPLDILDASQYFVQNMLLPHGERLQRAAERSDNDFMVDLPYALYEEQTKLIQRIMDEASQAGFPGQMVVVGGIQINTPPGCIDYFLPFRFDLYADDGQYQGSFLDEEYEEQA